MIRWPLRSRQQRQLAFLSRSALLEETGAPGFFRDAILLVAGCVTIFIAWTAVAQVEEVAITVGEILPAGSLQTIQHLEGGIVTEILAQEGELVERGQPLVRLDPTAPKAQMERLRTREAALLLQSARLRAFAERRAPDFSGLDKRYPDLLADQLTILQMQNQVRESKRRVHANLIQQRQAELQQLEAQANALRQQQALVQEELTMRRTLFDRGHSSRLALLDSQSRATGVQGELSSVLGKIIEVRQAIAEAENRLLELEAELQNEALGEIGRISVELAELRQAMTEQRDRLARTEIAAPVRGMVQDLRVNTIGAVLGPGDPVLDLVPLGADLVAETRMSPKDVGHVQVGLAAKLRVSAYDDIRYGQLAGRVKSISSSSFRDEQDRPYYKVVIALDHAYVGDDPTRNPTLPGMTVRADILTGAKSVLSYLLKPIERSLDEALSER
jgi:adhesin transport system membrane fusion protein